jgi:small subunit ribosomal protein S9
MYQSEELSKINIEEYFNSLSNDLLSSYQVAFPIDILQAKINQPFAATDTVGQYDVKVNVFGGGINGQAEAIRLGISRALVEISEENKPNLRSEGLLTRDPRMVERKKPGRPKARKRFQFSKR